MLISHNGARALARRAIRRCACTTRFRPLYLRLDAHINQHTYLHMSCKRCIASTRFSEFVAAAARSSCLTTAGHHGRSQGSITKAIFAASPSTKNVTTINIREIAGSGETRRLSFERSAWRVLFSCVSRAHRFTRQQRATSTS